MLHKSDIIIALHKELSLQPKVLIVTDPVMYAKSGDLLLEKRALEHLKKYILTISKVITPNLYEAQHLAEITITTQDDMLKAAEKIFLYGAKYVIVKGGHLKNDCYDLLYETESKQTWWLKNNKIATKNLHGTCCTFSAALAANIAYGASIIEATQAAKEYITQAIFHGAQYEIGHGSGPVHHFYNMWKKNGNK